MANLTLPIPSTVPLETLAMSIDTLLDRLPKERPTTSAIVTRLANVCRDRGIKMVWMLAIHSRNQLLCQKNCARKAVDCAERALRAVGCELSSFPELDDVFGKLHWTFGYTGRYRGFSESLMALAGVGNWAKQPAIIAALAEYGLRPAMPLEELFVYVPAVTEPAEPKKLTVAEELLAFGAMQASEAFQSQEILGGLTVLELMAPLALSPDRNIRERAELELAMQKHLSPRTLKKIGIRE